MRTFLFVLVLALVPEICGARITIDMTGAAASVKDSQTLSVQHITVPGYGIYTVEIKWNPDTLKFDVVVATAETSSPNPYPSNTYPLASSVAAFRGAFNTYVEDRDLGTILTLANGQFWQVTTGSIYSQLTCGDSGAVDRSLTIYDIQGVYTMSLNGCTQSVRVKPFTHIAKVESSVTNFSSASGVSGTILRLANGQAWQVTDGSAYGNPYVDPNPLPITIYQISSTKFVMTFGGSAAAYTVSVTRIN